MNINESGLRKPSLEASWGLFGRSGSLLHRLGGFLDPVGRLLGRLGGIFGGLGGLLDAFARVLRGPTRCLGARPPPEEFGDGPPGAWKRGDMPVPGP